jgi:hypothetical protein
MEEPHFTVTEYLNCRKFIKRYYTLTQVVDLALLTALEGQFGPAQVQAFSRYNPQAKDCLQIKTQDGLQISGVIFGELLYFVTPTQMPEQVEVFETVLKAWLNRQVRAAG